MDLKTAQLIEKIKNNKQLAEQIMHSGDGQNLMQLLTQSDGGKALSQAAQAAAGGDTQKLSRLLGELMKDPQAAELMNRLHEQIKK